MRFADLAGFVRRHSGFLLGLPAFAALATGGLQPAFAQQSIMQPGYAAVTGFAGTVASETPAGANPLDYVTIDYNGISATIVDLTTMGAQGELTEAPKVLSLTSDAIGQVYGVTLDNADEPNIYLAATSAYGLSIYRADQDGYVKRLRKGAPGAQFVPGQFGPEELGGGPGSIWRVDGITGDVELFANIESASLGAASLGGLAFDPVSQQIFVVDRGTGVIHRLTLDGVERGTYDHGIEGRPKAGLSPSPMPPNVPLNISSPAFNTENPATWRYAPIARRTFAVAVRNNRLYYSVAQGPQIWSVAIAPNGAVGGSPRIEVNVPTEQAGIEIASIAFDGQGRMYLAERGVPTGDYQLIALAAEGASRVLRYVPKPAGDPAPGLWRLDPDQYSIGMPAPYANAQGGVALGYGYLKDGSINPSACRATVWATGERLLDPGDPNTPPDSYPAVDGLQGTAISLVQPQNTPPFYSWYIDYDDVAGEPDLRGYMGAIATYAPCAGAPQPPPPPPPPPKPYCPPGTYLDDYGQCRIIPTCPPGTKYSNGVCVYPTCPPGYVEWQGQCVPPPQVCPPGTFFYKGDCYPISCPPNMVMKPNGYCVCKPGSIYYDGQCVPPNFCPPGMITLPGGICWCPFGTEMNNKGQCVPICKPGEKLINGFCVPEQCKPWEIKLPNGKCVTPCKPWEKMLPNGKCVPGGIVPECPKGEKWQNGVCVPVCKPWEKLDGGKCKPFDEVGPQPPKCKPWEKLQGNKCVPFDEVGPQPPKCKPWEKLQGNKCVPLDEVGPQPPKCKPWQDLKNGKCVDKPLGQKCKPWEELVNGECVVKDVGPKPPQCKPFEQLIDGECVAKPIGPKPPKCKFFEQLVNGKCVPKKVGPVEPVNPELPLEPQPPKCKFFEQLVNGKCVPKKIGPVEPLDPELPLEPKLPKCKFFEQLVDGQCVPKKAGQGRPVKPDLTIEPKLPKCKFFEELVDGQCVPKQKAIGPVEQVNPDQPVVPKLRLPRVQIQCEAGQKLVNGKCVIDCPPGQKLIDGACQSGQSFKPRVKLRNPEGPDQLEIQQQQ
jgi:hypothetical protein